MDQTPFCFSFLFFLFVFPFFFFSFPFFPEEAFESQPLIAASPAGPGRWGPFPRAQEDVSVLCGERLRLPSSRFGEMQGG